jgi:hypothetical protein
MRIATFGPPANTVESILGDFQQRLRGIFPEQTSETCA